MCVQAGDDCLECELPCEKPRPVGCTHSCPLPCHKGEITEFDNTCFCAQLEVIRSLNVHRLFCGL